MKEACANDFFEPDQLDLSFFMKSSNKCIYCFSLPEPLTIILIPVIQVVF